MYQFEAQLKKGSAHQGWTYVDIPAGISIEILQTGRVPVRGFIDVEAFRTSLLPGGDGTHYLYVSQPLQKKINKTAGDFVMVQFETDQEKRTVDVPEEIIDAFSVSRKALETFTNFSYSHKKELLQWIYSTRNPETRERRIIKAIMMLENYRKPGK